MIGLVMTGLRIILVISIFYLLGRLAQKEQEVEDKVSECVYLQKKINHLETQISEYKLRLKYSQPKDPKTGRLIRKSILPKLDTRKGVK